MDCPSCGALQEIVTVVEGLVPSASCAACNAIVFAKVDGPVVLVAHDSRVQLAEIGCILAGVGFFPVTARDGAEALRLAIALAPDAAVLDVALGDVLSLDLISAIRAKPRTAGMKIVLVASVYNRTAYKRKPTSLYGADDYVEQHHLTDMLPEKLQALLGVPTKLRVTASHPAVDPGVDAARMRNSGENAAERVRATAHTIVADIALYHHAEIESVITEGTLDGLQGPLREGRRILAQLIPEKEWPSQDPVLDAFKSLVDSMRGRPA
ncbi:MAG: response regulator [Clostridia bacterium]|nr:response regulator [Deltaproteobacteria bacterium]